MTRFDLDFTVDLSDVAILDVNDIYDEDEWETTEDHVTDEIDSDDWDVIVRK